MKKISKFISYKEATHSNSAKQFNISNKPKAEHIKNMELLAEKIFEPLREWVGHPIKVNSMYRSEKLNKLIKGSSNSSHLKGQAIDITSLGVKTNLEMFYYIIENLDFDQLIWEYGKEPKWLHVSYNSEKQNRNQILKVLSGSKYMLFDKNNICKNC